MLLRRLQLDARQRVLRPGNSVSDRLHIAVVGQNYATPARGHVSAVMVLRLLTEDFGGEASCASLTERILGQLSAFGNEDHLTEIRSELAQLESCGALALDDLDGTNVIARITLAGATMAYARLATETPPCQQE